MSVRSVDETTERLFREANQAVQRNRDPDPETLLSFLCECSDLDCRADIELTLAEYGSVRAGTLRFAVASDHETGNERVLDEFDRYTVVEK